MCSFFEDKKQLSKWGAIFLFLGLVFALCSNHFNTRAIGQSSMIGQATYALEEVDPELAKRKIARSISDWAFYVGILMTGVGIWLQYRSSSLVSDAAKHSST